jgi:hypothetical protein
MRTLNCHADRFRWALARRAGHRQPTPANAATAREVGDGRSRGCVDAGALRRARRCFVALWLVRSSPAVLMGWGIDLGFWVLGGVAYRLHVAQTVRDAEEFEGSVLQRGGVVMMVNAGMVSVG